MREDDGEHDGDENMSMHRFASSELEPLKDAMTQTCWTSAREERIRVLGRAMSYLLKALREAVKGEFVVEMKARERLNIFSDDSVVLLRYS